MPGELSGFVAQQSRPDSSAVAGFDLTFSPVKSVSTLWAVAPRELSERIEAAHDAAVTRTLEFLQSEAGYTRVGARGVAQVNIRGLVAARFTHRDSRAGDPDLHTHVAVSNKVQTLDGRWLALDARMLYRMTVAASEFYNTQLEAEVTTRVGGTFTERDTPDGKRPIRELAGVDERPERPVVQPPAGDRHRHRGAVGPVRHRPRPGADHRGIPAVRAAGHPGHPGPQTRTPVPRRATRRSGGGRPWRSSAGNGTSTQMVAAATARQPRRRPRWTGTCSATSPPPPSEPWNSRRARWRENHVLAEATRQTRAAGVAPGRR